LCVTVIYQESNIFGSSVAITQPHISAHLGNASFPVLYVSALVVLSSTLFGTVIKTALYIKFGSLVVNVVLD